MTGHLGRNIEQQYTEFESNFQYSVFLFMFPFLKNKYGRDLLTFQYIVCSLGLK